MTKMTKNAELPTKAIILAAGLGKRLYPITHAIPKPMLPLGRKPIIHHVIDELQSAGLKKIGIVLGQNDVVTPRYLSYMFPSIATFVQTKPIGTVDAILSAKDWICEEDKIIVAMGDAILERREMSNPLVRLYREFNQQKCDSAVLIREMNPPFGKEYIGIESCPKEPSFLINPIKDQNRQKMVINTASRWILSATALKRLEIVAPESDGEHRLRGLVYLMPRVLGVPLNKDEHCHDFGTWEHFLLGSAKASLNDQEFGDKINKMLLAT